MNKYISILRGINVSGQKKILMTDLKALYESLGCVNVKTYIQSGNVIFDYEDIISSHIQKFQESIKKMHFLKREVPIGHFPNPRFFATPINSTKLLRAFLWF